MAVPVSAHFSDLNMTVRAVLLDAGLMPLVAAFQDGLLECLIRHIAQCKTATTRSFVDVRATRIFIYEIGPGVQYTATALLLSREEADPRFAFHLAIANGDVEAVQAFLKCRPAVATADATDCAAKYGHEHLVRLLYPRVKCTNLALSLAAEEGHMAVVKYLVKCKVRSRSAIDSAARRGNVDIVRLLVHRGFRWSSRAMDDACRGGHLNVVKFLTEAGMAVGCSTDIIDLASAYGHLEVVDYLFQLFPERCSTNAMDWAATEGHLNVVAYLHRCGAACTTQAMNGAAQNGHLDVPTPI
ncbi:unnamed protein product [Aphanomyces euteiches]